MDILTNRNNLYSRHIGSARENRFRAQQQQQQRTLNNRIPIPQQPYLSPELIRARWNELYKEQNKNNIKISS